MEPKEYDFNFPRGDTCPISFDLTDNEGNELNLAESEIYFTVKKNYQTKNYIIQKTYSHGDITIDGTTVSFCLTHTDTANLSYGNYVYDIQIKSGDLVKTLCIGTITLTNEATWINNE